MYLTWSLLPSPPRALGCPWRLAHLWAALVLSRRKISQQRSTWLWAELSCSTHAQKEVGGAHGYGWKFNEWRFFAGVLWNSLVSDQLVIWSSRFIVWVLHQSDKHLEQSLGATSAPVAPLVTTKLQAQSRVLSGLCECIAFLLTPSQDWTVVLKHFVNLILEGIGNCFSLGWIQTKTTRRRTSSNPK